VTSNRIDREIIHKVTFVLAQKSLGADLIPTDFRRDEAERCLGESGFEQPRALTDRLVANGVVQERVVAGLSLLRFQFDPVAEHLVAISKCHALGSDRAAWLAMIDQLTNIRTYPDIIRGYLNALSVCYTSYKQPLKLADVQFPWPDK
jgi:hypothetical protein